ncbi:MAG: undecaprenyl-phosphate glucose phosphotransferase [Chloroflexota bacterium]|nr:undecaprenyl-phosphate glucose phosphotransferase [Chloroflexota bacterium]
MTRHTNFLFAATLLGLDAIMTCLAFLLAYLLRPLDANPNQVILPFSSYVGMMVLSAAALVVVFFFYRLYHLGRAMTRLDELYSLLPAVSVSVIFGVALTAFVYRAEVDYPRTMIVLFWFFALLLVGLGRLVHHTLRSSLYGRGWGESKVLIVGAGEAGNLILDKIRGSPSLGYRPVGFLDDTLAGQTVFGLPVLGRTDELGDVVEKYGIDEVIVALPEASHNELLSVISRCEDGRVSIKVFPDVFQIMASEVNVGDLNGLPLLTMRDVALRGWRLTLKRIVDMILSAIVLVFISPLLLLIVLLVKLDSRGPAIFSQERMGLDARPFPCFKFRSMVADAEAETGPVWAIKDDPRRTRIGRWLRRYSFDELPNFINVFLGHMSLVGPRPERPVFVEQFKQMVPRYMERHREKAGITGWAQVNGLRGDTSILERTKYDLYYIEHWSLWFDFKIMILTALKFLRDPNAM